MELEITNGLVMIFAVYCEINDINLDEGPSNLKTRQIYPNTLDILTGYRRILFFRFPKFVRIKVWDEWKEDGRTFVNGTIGDQKYVIYSNDF